MRTYFRTVTRLVLALLVMASSTVLVIPRAAAEPGDPPIRAAAFIDANADGQRQPGEVDFTDYEAFAYDGVGNFAPGVLDSTTGEFVFNITGLDSGMPVADSYRIEFVRPEAPYISGPMGDGSAAALPQSGSSVQFAGPGETIYWGVHNPAAFCQANAPVVATCFVNGDQINGPHAALDAIVSVGGNWGTDTGTSGDLASWMVDENGVQNTPNQVASASQVGTTWGEAWNRRDSVLYASAYLKNYSGYGPGGPNAIYQTPMDPYTGLPTGPATVFATVGAGDGVTVCPDHHTDLVNPGIEPNVFPNVGKCSFGDIEISNDGSRLYAMSLAGREVLEFNTATGALLNQYPMLPEVASGNFAEAASTCPNENKDFRPFALGVHPESGLVYAGAMCVFEGDGRWQPDLQAYVFTLDPATGTWTEVFATNYQDFRSYAAPWSTDYATIRAFRFAPGEEFDAPVRYFGNADMMLTDIEFFGDDLTLGFRSRIGDQLGDFIPDPLDPDPSDTEFIRTGSGGDLMCVFWDGASYQQETSNSCGPDRNVDPALITGLDPNGVGVGPGKGDAPSDEFYWGDGANWVTSPSPGFVFDEPFHTESFFGGLSQQGFGPLVGTTLNPSEPHGSQIFNSGGLGFYNQTDGSSERAYLLYESGVSAQTAQFGKSNGLGDVEHLCVAAPLQIGNYVWYDADGDGIQDGSERPVAGVTVNLYDTAGNLIATTVTDANGNYVFDSAGPDGLPANGDDLFGSGDDLVIRLDNPADYAAGGPLEDWTLTIDSAADGSSGTPDDQDSDATTADSAGIGSAFPEIEHTTGAIGSNDHTLDFGFTKFDLALRKQLADGTNLGNAAFGDSVTFTIEVFNQGGLAATDIEITDYVPAGLVLNDSDWTASAAGATTTIPGPLAPGDSTTVDITFQVGASATGTIENLAEISDGTPIDENGNTVLGPDGQPIGDADSTPDTTPGNDNNLDDVILNPGPVDEDDHDGARLRIAPMFDLALTKQLADGTNLGNALPGDSVTFVLRVYNQGEVDAVDIELTDYIPSGLTLNSPNWTDNGDDTATLTNPIPGPLAPGDDTFVTITFTVDTDASGTLVNWAEISNADDDGDPTTTAPRDIDSIRDKMQGNDEQPSGPNDTTDDEIDENGRAGGDEDDHDVAGIAVNVFDLALTKQLADGTNLGSAAPGDSVTFTIEVFNQGTVPAVDIALADYIPAGLTLADSDWNDNGFGTASLATPIAGPLAPGASTTVDITFTVDNDATGTLINTAEISNADDDGDPATTAPRDIDSIRDMAAGNDTAPTNPNDPTDDEIDEDGRNGGDEDDHDIAGLNINVFDLALTKQLADGTNLGSSSPGDSVTFTIEVFNQGNVPAVDIALVDYIPTGLTLADSDWNDNGSGIASLATPIPGPLAPGASTAVDITFTVDVGASGTLINTAEISNADDDGDPTTTAPRDIDSIRDMAAGNDTAPTNPNDPTDDEIDEDGRNGGDEDDHDIAGITVNIFDLALTKQLGDGTNLGEVAPGDSVTFVLRVFNQGNVPAVDIELTDYIPNGLTLNAANWTDNADGTATLTNPIPGPLAPGANTFVTISFTVDADATGTLINTAEISNADDDGDPTTTAPVDVDSTRNDDPADDNAPTNPNDLTDDEIDEDGRNGGDEDDHDIAGLNVNIFDLALTKQLADGTNLATVMPGDTVTFTIEVFNQGNVPAVNIELSDYMPAGLTLADSDWTGALGTATLNTPIPGPLAPGSSTTVDITFTVDADARGSIINTAEISNADDDGDPATTAPRDIDSTRNSNPADDSAPTNPNDPTDDEIDEDGRNGGDEDDHDIAGLIVNAFDLALTKQLADGTNLGAVSRGDSVTFTIEVFNQGNVPAVDIALVDYIPAGLTLADSDWNDNGSGTASLATPIAGPLAPGASTTVDITFTVDNNASGTLINTAEISNADDDGDPTTTAPRDIDSIRDSAEGNDNAPTAPGDATDDEIDEDGRNGGDEDDHDIAGVSIDLFDLALRKQLADGTNLNTVVPGDSVTFVLEVFNQGNVGAVDIELTDYIPAGLTLDAPNWTDNGDGTATLTNPIPGPLAPGDDTFVTISFTVDADARGALINTAEISNADDDGDPTTTAPVDIDSSRNNDPDDDNAPTNPNDLTDDEIDESGRAGGDEDDHDIAGLNVNVFDLALTKQLADGTNLGSAAPGGSVTFTIEVFNQGNVPAVDISVSDYIPAGLTLADTAWNDNGSGSATLATAIPGPLAPGASTTIDITFTVDTGATGTLINTAEISNADDDGDPTTTAPVDVDSIRDMAAGNDNAPTAPDDPTDDEIDENGRTGGDEDDHDIAGIMVDLFDLALTKQLADGTNLAAVSAGDTVTFVLEVTNQGNVAAVDIELTDYAPTGLTLDAPNWTDNGDGTATLTNPIPGPLAPGDSTTVTISFTVDDSARGTLINAAEISNADDDGDPATMAPVDIDSMRNSDPSDDTAPTNPNDPTDDETGENGRTGGDEDDHDIAGVTIDVFDLALTKGLLDGSNLGSAKPGDPVTFLIEVFNQGNVPAVDIVISDYIPAGLTLADPAWNDNGSGTATLATPIAGPLAPGTSTTVTISFTVDANASGTIVNTAEISNADDDGDPSTTAPRDVDSIRDAAPSNDTAPTNPNDPTDDETGQNGRTGGDEDDHDIAGITITPLVFDLALTKQLADGTNLGAAAPGDQVTFVLTVINQGEVPAVDVELTDYAPAGLTLAAAAWTDNGDGTATLTNPIPGPIAPGDSTFVTITYAIDAGVSGTLINQAEITNADDDGDPSTMAPADIDSTRDSDPTNDNAPATPNAPTDDETGEDGRNGGDEDDHDLAGIVVISPEVPVFDLALTKQLADGSNSAPVQLGQTVTFTITVINQGETHAENMVVTDYLPAMGLTLNDPDWTDNADGSASITIAGPLAPGASTTVDIDLLATGVGSAGGPALNWAEISDADPTDGSGTIITDPSGNPVADIDSTPDTDPGNDMAPTGPNQPGDDVTDENGLGGGDEDDHDVAGVVFDPIVPPTQVFDLALTKQLADGTNLTTVQVGDTVTFTITVINQGDTHAENMVITDHLPAAGLALSDPDWTDNGNGTASITIPGPVAPGASTSVDIDMTAVAGATGTVMNLAEISGGDATDGAGTILTDPNGNPLVDIDSTPDTNPGNDTAPAGPNAPTDDAVDGDGRNGGDEDDHDLAAVRFDPPPLPVFDLALTKQLADGSNLAEVQVGDPVTFTLTIINQGDTHATDITLVDYVPDGLTLADPDWAARSDGSAEITLTGITLAPGEQATVDITMTVSDQAEGTISNYAEIAEAIPTDVNGAVLTNPDGSPLTDVDSTPDATDDDPVGDDDAIDGRNNDEDDHDIAQINVARRLAFTGSEPRNMLLLGLGLISLGTIGMAAGKVRRKSI